MTEINWGTASDPQLTLTRLSDVLPERVEWLWHGRLPVGKPVTLDGDPGLGKSTLALKIAATVSNGGSWPDGGRCEHPGDVLLLSAEDGLADTVRPRLDAAGADVTRVHAIEGKSYLDAETGERYLRPLTLADIADLERAMKLVSARLLVVDVLMAFLSNGTDSHKDQDIRRVLSALSAAAERNDCTVLLLRHLNKAKGGDPLYRGGGSIGIVGAARAGLLVAADPDDPTRRVLACVKSNLGQMPDSLAYRLVDCPDLGVARVEWEGVTGYDAHRLLAGSAPDEDRHDVDQWLSEFLANGSKKANEVYSGADAAGYSKDQAKRAKKRLGVLAVRETGDGPWFWKLPAKGATDQGSTPDTQNSAPLLPCTSEGVREAENRPREQGAPDRPLGQAQADPPAPSPNAMASHAHPPALITSRRARTIKGKPTSSYPNCTICGQSVSNGTDTHYECRSKQQAAS
ncbi:AAA family ATPase [Mycobacterium sp. SMC-4]|uniref:AAA family ATPase n=1 Tax=Mycobacterium sp. SMC-4 TaxID=2857059 RepID=UPI0021B16244|nr:AAA family ATPase [Mycobacterium sp. SMC-4]UXA17028.1 AAA family ATPase [Mycobacterium sp. SMC-4]